MERDALGERVEVMWLIYTKFRAWQKYTYANNKKRASHMKENPIRFNVSCPKSAMLQVLFICMLQLTTMSRSYLSLY